MSKEASLQIEMASKLDTEESKMLLKGSKKPDFDNSGSSSFDLPELKQNPLGHKHI